jgi:hypothetical protein
MSSNQEVVAPTGEVIAPANEVNEPIEDSEPSNTVEGGEVAESLYSEDGNEWGNEPTPISSPAKEYKDLASKLSDISGEMKSMTDVMNIMMSKLHEVVCQNKMLKLHLQQGHKYADAVKDDGVRQPVVEEPSPPEEPSISTIIAEFCRVFGKSIPSKEGLSERQEAILARYFTTTTYRKVIATVNSSIEGVFYSKTLIVGDHIESASDFYIRKCIINILQFMYGVFHSKFEIGRLDEEILINSFIKSGVIERGETSPVKITELGLKHGTAILEQFTH